MKKTHLEFEELDEILERGFQDCGRRSVVLTHLASPCATCRQCLRRRAIESADVAPVVRTDEQDAVVWALRREVSMLRFGESMLAEMRPAHSHWARRTETTPLAFARLVMEESFEAELLEPALAVIIAETSLRSLDSASALADVEPAQYQDLRALACGRLADAHQQRGNFEVATELFRRAWEILMAGGSAAPMARHRGGTHVLSHEGLASLESTPWGLEVLATVEELRSGFDLAQGLPWQALDRLEFAGRFLDGTCIAGRWSEHLLHRGRVLSVLKRFSEARGVLADALAALPIPSSPRLQLEIIHHQAALELQEGDSGRAYGLLIEFKDLYLDHGAPLMKVQRCWLLARVAYLMHCDRLARPRFQQALDGFLHLGREVEALYVVTDLIRCCVRMGSPPDEFLTLRKALVRLFESSTCREVSGEIWRKFLQEALEEGWCLPWMEGLLEVPPSSSIH